MLNLRLFTGLSLPPQIVGKLEEVLARLTPLASIRWSPAANLHITTKFIGAWPFSRVSELCMVLEGVRALEPVTVKLGGLEFFPGALVGKVEEGSGLRALVVATEAALSRLGIAPEEREYRPHVTLARMPQNCELPELRAEVERWRGQEWGEFEAGEFHLFQSEQQMYRPIASMALK